MWKNPNNNKKTSEERAKMLGELASKYGLVCWYCGFDLEDDIHIDHIIPKSKGGSHTIENRALSCKRCNMAKWNYPLEDLKAYHNHIRSRYYDSKI